MTNFTFHAGRNVARLAALAATGLAALALASPAPAGTIVDKYVEVPNCNTNGQLCPPKVGTQFLATQGFIKVEFTANPNHCSDITAIMSFDDEAAGDGGSCIPAKRMVAM